MAFTAATSCQGVTLNFGAYSGIGVISMQYSRSASGEIDLTHMGSEMVTDPQNSGRKLLKKSTSFGIIDPGELTIEFYGPGGFDENAIGQKATLSIAGVDKSPSCQAILTQISTQIAAGDLVKGNCTFKLTGD